MYPCTHPQMDGPVKNIMPLQPRRMSSGSINCTSEFSQVSKSYHEQNIAMKFNLICTH